MFVRHFLNSIDCFEVLGYTVLRISSENLSYLANFFAKFYIFSREWILGKKAKTMQISWEEKNYETNSQKFAKEWSALRKNGVFFPYKKQQFHQTKIQWFFQFFHDLH